MNKTIPTMAAVVSLVLTAFAQSPGQSNEGSRVTHDATNNLFTLSWWGRAGQSYFIQHSEDLLNWSYYPQIWVGQEAVASMGLQTSAPNYFLRLEIEADPFNVDSDHDGIPDGWEVLHGLNPHDGNDAFDMAPGGLTYLQKYQMGLDPTKADTDGDGVPDNLDMFPNDPRRSEPIPAKFYAVTDLSAYLPDSVKPSFDAQQIALDDNHNVAFFGTSGSAIGPATTGHVYQWQSGTLSELRNFPMALSFESSDLGYADAGLVVNGINPQGTLATTTYVNIDHYDSGYLVHEDATFWTPWPLTAFPVSPGGGPTPLGVPDRYGAIAAVNNAGETLSWDRQWNPVTYAFRYRTVFRGQEVPILCDGGQFPDPYGQDMDLYGLNEHGAFLVRIYEDDGADSDSYILKYHYYQAGSSGGSLYDAPEGIQQIRGAAGAHQAIGGATDELQIFRGWFAVEDSPGHWTPVPLLDLLKWTGKPVGTRDDWDKFHSALRNIYLAQITDPDPATAGIVIAGRTYPNGVPSSIIFYAHYAEDDAQWSSGTFILEFDNSSQNHADWHYRLAERALPAGVSFVATSMNSNGTMAGLGDIQAPEPGSAAPGNAPAVSPGAKPLETSPLDFKPRKWVVTEPNTNPADLLIGFDPPIAGDRTPQASDKDVPEWWASITTTGPLSTNQKLRVTLGKHPAGISYKLVVTGDLAGKLTVTPATVTSDSTDITLQAMSAAAGGQEPLTGKVEVRQVGPGAQEQKLAGPALNVQMFPPITVNVGIYFVDDPNTAKDDVPLPRPVTAAGIIAALNKTYAASGITFQTQASQTYPSDSVLPWPYDADNDGKLSFLGGTPEADSIYHFENALPAKLNIILAKDLLYRPPIGGITEIWADEPPTIIKHRALFVKWDGRTVDTIIKTCVHEIGHALRISSRKGYDPTYLGGRYMTGTANHQHDLGVFPNDALRELSGNPLSKMFGIMYRDENADREFWLRNEDWQPAWDTANQKFK